MKWHRDTTVAIGKIFGSDSTHRAEFTNIRYHSLVTTHATNQEAHIKAYQRGLVRAEATLGSLVSEVDDYWEDDHLMAEMSIHTLM